MVTRPIGEKDTTINDVIGGLARDSAERVLEGLEVQARADMRATYLISAKTRGHDQTFIRHRVEVWMSSKGQLAYYKTDGWGNIEGSGDEVRRHVGAAGDCAPCDN